MIRDSYGLVLCGGQSTRMKTDKCFLNYLGLPQWQHVYQLLRTHCKDVFISCNHSQQGRFGTKYPLIVDHEAFKNNGPITALLSAFATFPDRDLLIVGCDYPFLSKEEVNNFSRSIDSRDLASAFFNEPENLYEPVLGWYSHRCKSGLAACFAAGKYSLQHFLKSVDAKKYFPTDGKSIMSIDTRELMEQTVTQIKSDICR